MDSGPFSSINLFPFGSLTPLQRAQNLQLQQVSWLWAAGGGGVGCQGTWDTFPARPSEEQHRN